MKLVRAICSGIYWRATADSEKVDDEEDQPIHDYRTTTGQLVNDVIRELMKDLQFIPKLQLILEVFIDFEVLKCAIVVC